MCYFAHHRMLVTQKTPLFKNGFIAHPIRGPVQLDIDLFLAPFHCFGSRISDPEWREIACLFEDNIYYAAVFEAFKFVISKDADQLHQFLHSPFSPWQITLNLENLLPPSDEWTRIPDNLIGIKWI